MKKIIGKIIYFLLALLGAIMLPIVLISVATVYPDSILAKIINFLIKVYEQKNL